MKKEKRIIPRKRKKKYIDQTCNHVNYPVKIFFIRRLNYSIDKDGNKHLDFYYEDERKMEDEINCCKLLEGIIGGKVYLNPKTHSNGFKTPDFWAKKENELWDLKCIDGNSEIIIDNILHNASRRFQTPNIILKCRKTIHTPDKLAKQIKYIFDNNYKKKIKKVILFDKNGHLILYYIRK